MKFKMMKMRLAAIACTAAMGLSSLVGAPVFAAAGTIGASQSFSGSSETKTASGDMELIYDTTNGETDGVKNGSVTVTIPSKIQYDNVPAGQISLDKQYTVNVKGIIGPTEKVVLTATPKYEEPLLNVSVAQTKTEFSADDCYGTNRDGNFTGTNSTDTVSITGTIKTRGTYVDYVTYSATYQTASAAEQEHNAEVAAAAQAVTDQIAALPATDSLTLSDEAAVKAARAAYDALDAEAKQKVSGYETLTADEAKIAELKQEEQDRQANQAAANVVIAKINAIGSVTKDSESAITEARNAYDALTDTQKGLVTNYQTLVDAEAAFDALPSATEMVASTSLPTESGQVVTMSLADLYNALPSDKFDPTNGYTTSTYYVYAINNTSGTNDSNLSTAENLNKIGAAYFATKPMPTSSVRHFTNATDSGYSVFGGPLYYVNRNGVGTYGFNWWCSSRDHNDSSRSDYWRNDVPGSVSVAVVRR